MSFEDLAGENLENCVVNVFRIILLSNIMLQKTYQFFFIVV